jgi:hypothetical protein
MLQLHRDMYAWDSVALSIVLSEKEAPRLLVNLV